MSRTIVFIHGNFVTRRSWDPWVALCESRGYRCVTIAYPGRDAPVDVLRAREDDGFLGALTIERVIEHHVKAIRALAEKPFIIGHSFGGLLTQQMVARDLAAAAVAIDSVPPANVPVLEWSSIRSIWPVLNPFIPASRPYLMPFRHFQYAFVNDMSAAEQRKAWDVDVVPESRRLGRGGLSRAARIDFTRAHAPLLLIGGEKDHIMPAATNRRNKRAYAKSSSVVEYREFAGLGHYSVIGGNKGWEQVADYALGWLERQTAGTQTGAGTARVP